MPCEDTGLTISLKPGVTIACGAYALGTCHVRARCTHRLAYTSTRSDVDSRTLSELIVTSGLRWAQRWGGSTEEIRPGDVVWFAPGRSIGTAPRPRTAMTHIAIQEALNGKPVNWMERVSDEHGWK